MYYYETKSDIPETVQTYIEFVSEKTIDALDLHEITLFLNDLEDWYDNQADQKILPLL
jgi:hypothetical protein